MFDPFSALGGVAGKLVADTWSAMMMTVWSGGLWVLRMVLQLENHFLTPAITTDGPASESATGLWLFAASTATSATSGSVARAADAWMLSSARFMVSAASLILDSVVP